MKNQVMMFLLGVFATISVAATNDVKYLVDCKPVKPISIVVNNLYTSQDAKEFILKYSKEGYIVKSASGSNSYWIVVMEKY